MDFTSEQSGFGKVQTIKWLTPDAIVKKITEPKPKPKSKTGPKAKTEPKTDTATETETDKSSKAPPQSVRTSRIAAAIAKKDQAQLLVQAEIFLKAAQYQHAYALRIRSRMESQKVSAKAYADQTNTQYDRLVKILRGQVLMRLEDLAAADRVFGDITQFAVTERDRQALLQERKAAC